MCDALGIINFEDNVANVTGMLNYRSLAAVSFLGRYRLIDFVLSNMSNSGIEQIQLYIKEKPRSIIEHVGTGKHYNINSKRGKLHILYGEGELVSSVYNHDIMAFRQNIRFIEESSHRYVIIAPSYMLYSIDYNEVLKYHTDNRLDITVVYQNVDDADYHYDNCDTLILDKEKRVVRVEKNLGKYKKRNISLECYVMSKRLFLELIEKAGKISSLFTLKDVIADSAEDLLIQGYRHYGAAYCINTMKHYYEANMELRDYQAAKELFRPNWPIYTKTNDSEPTLYTDTAKVQSSTVANGCLIEGEVIDSVIGRNVIIRKGAQVRNSVLLAGCYVDENVILDGVVVDKQATIRHAKKLLGSATSPLYIKRNDKI